MYYIDKTNPRKACPVSCIPCREILAYTNLKTHFEDFTYPKNFIVQNWNDVEEAVIAESLICNLKIAFQSLSNMIAIVDRFTNPFKRKEFFDNLKKDITITNIGDYPIVKKFMTCLTKKAVNPSEEEKKAKKKSFQVLGELLNNIARHGEEPYKDFLKQKEEDKKLRQKKDAKKNEKKKQNKKKNQKDEEEGYDNLKELEEAVEKEN